MVISYFFDLTFMITILNIIVSRKISIRKVILPERTRNMNQVKNISALICVGLKALGSVACDELYIATE